MPDRMKTHFADLLEERCRFVEGDEPTGDELRRAMDEEALARTLCTLIEYGVKVEIQGVQRDAKGRAFRCDVRISADGLGGWKADFQHGDQNYAVFDFKKD